MTRRSGWLLFLAVLAVVTAAKLAVVCSGADYDGDAYAHAMAGRRMLEDPRDATVHWVWLPLLHALYAAATAAGGGLSTLRLFNALLSSATPLLLAWTLHAHLRTTPARPSAPFPWLAGALLAADPLGLWLGVTGQTEPLFQIFVLTACIAGQRRAFTAAGVLLAAACLTRYEAWLLLPVIFTLIALERPQRPRLHLAWALPALAIAGWCLFHYRKTGEPLQFLRYNRDFVQGYLAGMGYPWGREPNLPLMAVFYIAIVPALHMLGPAHALTLAAIPRGRRDLPRWLHVVGAALLAIVTLGFLRGTHLGLPRHAVVLAPLYCALAAIGTSLLADKIAPRFPKTAPERIHHLTAIAVLAVVLLARTAPRTVSLWDATRSAFIEQAAAARALRAAAAPGEPIFCDDGKIEVLSELAPPRFIRWQLPDVAPMHVADLANSHGSALMVGAPSRAAHLPGGSIVWSGGGLVILRFEGPRGAAR